MFTPPMALTPLRVPKLYGIRARPRLFRLLDGLRDRPMLWIGGGPGAGKTTLIASYIKECRLPASWYRIEGAEGASGSSSRDFGAADTGPPARLWHEPAQIRAEGPASGAGVGRWALRELWCHSTRPGMIIFEDCHELPADAPFHTLLADSYEAIPAGTTVVLIGRGEPPAVYARLIANGTMVTLSGHELQLSTDETRALLSELVSDEAIVDTLQQRCGGWATGVALALGALRRHPEDSEQRDHALRSGAFSYFATALFDRISPEARQMLLSTALLPSITARIAEALSGTPEAWRLLNDLAGRHMFISRRAGASVSCEFVPLFREFLLARLEDSLPPGELSALSGRASALLEQWPAEQWLIDCDLLRAYAMLRGGDRAGCHRLLCDALIRAPYVASARQACLVFPTCVAELCDEALRAEIAVESARKLIQRYRLPPPAKAGPQWPWSFSVHVLGRFRLLKDGAPIRFSRRTQRKPLELLQALIAFGGTEVGAGALTDALWPDSEGDAGYHALESALYRLRQLLGAPDAVRMAGSKLSLDRRQFWVDMWELEGELQSSARNATETAHLARTRQLYEGHFLEHESEKPWALKTRHSLRDRFLRKVREAARVCEARRHWSEAARAYQTGLELDPLAEDLYRGLMVCHRELGDHSEALHAYRRCRELLTRLVGVPPNAKTQAIYHSVRQSAIAEPG